MATIRAPLKSESTKRDQTMTLCVESARWVRSLALAVGFVVIVVTIVADATAAKILLTLMSFLLLGVGDASDGRACEADAESREMGIAV